MSRVPTATVVACLLTYLSSFTSAAQPNPLAKANPYTPILGGLKARCIGPANMGGRICDLAVVESNPDIYYVAVAGGGVWKTTDAGATFLPVFDDQPTQCIGAVALCQGKPDVVYVGTGEANPRNSVSRGNGVYRSPDGGKTWKHCGLDDTHHIGRIVVHPRNPDIAYVAALGHCWGENRARGMYKTIDGGKTWDLVKFIDADTGFVDVQMDPADPDTLYAAAWQVRRDGFSGGNPRTQVGPAGGLFKTTDGGKTWDKLGGGLPEKVAYGRCGLSVYRKDSNIVFAVVHTAETAGQFTNAGQAATLTGKDGKPVPLARVETGGVFRSDDKGKTWKKINDLVPRPFYYGQIRVDPADEKHLYVLGVAFHYSANNGAKFTTIGQSIHPDHHALWINPQKPEHLIVGNDGGLYASKDRGRTWDAKRGLVISQFYGVAVDNRTPYHVYGGLQDNGSWGGPSRTPYPDGVTLSDWKRLIGADGFQAACDPTDPNTVYVEAQNGGLSRVNIGGLKGPIPKGIRPPPAQKGDAPHRYNWNSPILLSPHDSKTLYYGAQYLFKSTDRGDKWTQISPDLTAAPKDFPALPFAHNILATAESPVKQGVLWVGTDDGKLWVTKSDGKDWTEVGNQLPELPRSRAVSKIECSHFTAGTAMVAIDRHRQDDFKPYIFITIDYGETWKAIAGNLPDGAVIGVVRQSSKQKFLLFAGTELGLFVTFDAGTHWHHLTKTGMPRGIRVDDLVIHPRERELVIGTHGRGIWVMDIAPLEQLSEKILAADSHLFDVKPVTLFTPRKRDGPALPGFKAPNPPNGVPVSFLNSAKTVGKVELTCQNAEGKRAGRYLGNDAPGLDGTVFEVTEAGEYTITLKVGDEKQTKKVTVKAAE